MIFISVIFILLCNLSITFSSQTAPEAVEIAPLDVIYSSTCQALTSSRYITGLHTPVHKIMIGHTASQRCDSLPSCCVRVRNIQQKHFNAGLSDNAWNWMIGGDGNIYEGRGWDKIGAHTEDQNYGSIGIAFIGTYQTEPPTDKEIKAFKRLIREGIKLKKITEEYIIKTQNQFLNTSSPGAAALEEIKKWQFYSP